LQGNNVNGAWGSLLSELSALKAADHSSRYYYGVVRTNYTSGIGGIGYIGGGARTAAGWDRLPGGSYVMAHEVAHNMGRNHAPCGAPNPDPAYPYTDGKIGVWGFDPRWIALRNPAQWVDLTGYCNPYWVSDYSWKAMVGYRQDGPNNTAEIADAVAGTKGLLIWGRITPEGPVLEPAFSLEAGAELPVPGPHRIEVRTVDGSLLESIPFQSSPIADLPSGPEEAFAFVLPSGQWEGPVSELRLIADGKVAIRRASPAGDPALRFGENRDRQSRTIQWDASRYPMLLVRDCESSQILSFARGGSVRLPPVRSLDLTLSDGVKSRRIRQ
jgi:Peptidase M66